MTWTKKQKLPALHQSGKVKNPDMPEVEQQNYTSTVLKYANLALPFPQLETDAKRVVPAINELHKNRTIANPEEPADQDPLNTVQIAGTVYKIEGGGGGGDYTAGVGIYFTGNNNSVINADAGRLYRTSQDFAFSTNEGPSEGIIVPCWEDSGTTVDEHTVYQTHGGTYKEPSGDSVCTFTVSGYSDFTIYAKQNPATSSFRYLVFGSKDEEIDLEHGSGYDAICQNRPDSGYIHEEYSLGGESCTVQLMYHKEPYAPGISVDLNNGQFVDTGTTIDEHPVYKSDAGSYHIGNGVSLCTLTIMGVTSFTVYFRTSSESNYDWAYVGYLDEAISRTYYKSRLSGNSSYTAVTFECSSDMHTLEIMYAKDSSVDYGDDRAYFYSVVNEYAPTPTDDDRAYAFIVLGTPYVGGEYFNDYINNKATGIFSHAEGQNTLSSGWNSHAEGYRTNAEGADSHAEGSNNTASGGHSHAEGENNIAQGTSSHVEGARNVAVGQNAHVEGMDNETGEQCAHAEGASTKALGAQSHAEGWGTLAESPNSHAEGRETQAIGWRSHAEGTQSVASGDTSHAEGWYTQAKGGQDHSEGAHTIAEGGQSHAEGYETHATGGNSHAEGAYTLTSARSSHAEGEYTVASGRASHAEGYGDKDTQVIASGKGSHAEGSFTQAIADFAHTEGYLSIASGAGSHAEGYGVDINAATRAIGLGSHAEGNQTKAEGIFSHAEGERSWAFGGASHAENSSIAYGYESHAEGSGTMVGGDFSHTEGAGNQNIANFAHVEGAGNKNISLAGWSHTEGAGNINYGMQAHLEGAGNTLSGMLAHVEGAGNQSHGEKTHTEGGGNTVYAYGSHIEGKHNVVMGAASHAEGRENYIGPTVDVNPFYYGQTYAVGDIVGVNAIYTNTDEYNTSHVYRCITAPGQIQESSVVQIISPATWNANTTYPAGSIVKRVSNLFGDPQFVGYYYTYNESTGQDPLIYGGAWTRISSFLSPFSSTQVYSGSLYLLDVNCELPYYGGVVAKILQDATIPAMWEPVTTPIGSHIEGFGNSIIGDYQHVQGKYNAADANKAFIIGNGTADNARSNALTVDWSGNTAIAGDLTTGVTLNTTAQTIGAAINEISIRVPTPPTTDGNYTLSLTITNGVPTYSWVSS